MAKVIGTVGDYSKKLIRKRRIFKFVILVFLATYIFFAIYTLFIPLIYKDYFYFFPFLNFKSKFILIGLVIFSVVVSLIFIYEVYNFYKDYKSINRKLFGVRKGFEAEKKVESILSKLNDDYLVIHDLILRIGKKKKANIDHIVIYKPKNLIFLLETKSVVNPTDKQIKFWYRFIYFFKDKLIELLKKENLENEVDYKIIPILLLVNSNIHKTISKIPISNGKTILDDINKYSKAYKSYGKGKSINWEELFRKLKKIS